MNIQTELELSIETTKHLADIYKQLQNINKHLDENYDSGILCDDESVEKVAPTGLLHDFKNNNSFQVRLIKNMKDEIEYLRKAIFIQLEPLPDFKSK